MENIKSKTIPKLPYEQVSISKRKDGTIEYKKVIKYSCISFSGIE